MSFGEILVIALLAIVVVGPKDLPRVLRMAGRLLGQAKRAIADVRRETGLDEVLRGDFQDLERLADHIERIDAYKGDQPAQLGLPGVDLVEARARREREYPTMGADAPGLLPEDAMVYADSPWGLGGPAVDPMPVIRPAEGAVAVEAEPKGEEPAAEAPKADEPKAEEPKAEGPKADRSPFEGAAAALDAHAAAEPVEKPIDKPIDKPGSEAAQ
ncbi:MAG: twin-arginine translocase TatA/TatE family subunit [Myxococcales bacterium]|nr:twin-arginine translocase TatA/TatE family subunit [Myxococcales bacterium]